tara:strand:- start:772 stop:969 length:198 start_codon:yes stop_codon:yes gene_type:complete
MICTNKISIFKPSGINSATLEFEEGSFKKRNCGSTDYEGNIKLCSKCHSKFNYSYEWEKDNPSYE